MNAQTKEQYLQYLQSLSEEIVAFQTFNDVTGQMNSVLGGAVVLKDQMRELSEAETLEILSIIERAGRAALNMFSAFQMYEQQKGHPISDE